MCWWHWPVANGYSPEKNVVQAVAISAGQTFVRRFNLPCAWSEKKSKWFPDSTYLRALFSYVTHFKQGRPVKSLKSGCFPSIWVIKEREYGGIEM